MLEALRTYKHVVVFELVNVVADSYYIDFSLNATLEVDKIIEDLREGQHRDKKLQKDWNKYGYKAFKLNIIEHLGEDTIKRRYREEDVLLKYLYDRMQKAMAYRKSLGQMIYNGETVLDYEKVMRKYFTYTREGKRVIRPYKQKVILDEDTKWAVLLINSKDFPPHSHEEMELIYVIDHCIDITLNNHKYHLKPRDILFVSSKDIHSFTTPGELCNRLVLIFKTPLIGDVPQFLTKQKPKDPFIPYEAEEEALQALHSDLEEELLKIIYEYKHKEVLYTLSITANIYHVLSIMARKMVFVNRFGGKATQFYKEIETAERVFSYIHQHYQEAITLQDAADAASYSIYHFTRFFKKMTGMTFNAYLTNLRIEKSAEILLETDQSVAEVAYSCGFNSIKTYNRVFKAQKGISPRTFRNSNK